MWKLPDMMDIVCYFINLSGFSTAKKDRLSIFKMYFLFTKWTCNHTHNGKLLSFNLCFSNHVAGVKRLPQRLKDQDLRIQRVGGIPGYHHLGKTLTLHTPVHIQE